MSNGNINSGNQWGHLNPEVQIVQKRKKDNRLGLLETKSSSSEDEDSDQEIKDSGMQSKMLNFMKELQKAEEEKDKREEEKARRKEEREKAKIEPNRWGPWIEFFDESTQHPYFYNEKTKETVWELSQETKEIYIREKEEKLKKIEKENQKKIEKEENKREESRTSKSRSRSRSRSHSRTRSPARRTRSRSKSPSQERKRAKKRSPSPSKLRKLEKDLEARTKIAIDKLKYFKFDNQKNLHSLQLAFIQLQARLEDFEAGKLDAFYFQKKVKEHENAISRFEETAAPSGHSLLWDTTDQTYGYVNNFSGEVTFSYPSLKPSEKTSGTPTRVYKSSKSSKSDSTPWKYGEDGSVSGVLGGGKKRTPLEAYQKSQTDILKDQVYAEKAQRLRADEEVKSTRPKQNEMNDRRLARLGIKIDASPEKKSEDVIFTPKFNEKTRENKKVVSEKLSKVAGDEKEDKGNCSDDAMLISDEEEVQPQEKRKKRRKKEKTVKSKPSDSKKQNHLLDKWRQRKEEEQTNLWDQLGI
ncbi:Oidioi.mRNA.OKI2018_I69.PAR.g11834.t1.cds [Oikopleura dioica]|uniref:Oidioi.mRNA.OKI2018_I69.PAR.g11834.t1.cds n=1 Tax=Oikopleura dioica TaxID=34765 RepID=A0ABN7S0N3_OIKDI|nr:Oidioi.mRNA.OKI2018_I69.PAR.g11834.t1.cds [Oikopleura dioica]